MHLSQKISRKTITQLSIVKLHKLSYTWPHHIDLHQARSITSESITRTTSAAGVKRITITFHKTHVARATLVTGINSVIIACGMNEINLNHYSLNRIFFYLCFLFSSFRREHLTNCITNYVSFPLLILMPECSRFVACF